MGPFFSKFILLIYLYTKKEYLADKLLKHRRLAKLNYYYDKLLKINDNSPKLLKLVDDIFKGVCEKYTPPIRPTKYKKHKKKKVEDGNYERENRIHDTIEPKNKEE